MKIEPRHGMKKPAYAAAATLIASAALLTGCGGLRPDGTVQAPPTESTDTEQTTELILSGDVSFIETSPDLCTDDSSQYELFMEKINELEDSSNGNNTYSFKEIYDEEREGYYYVLTAFEGDGKELFVVSDGIVSWYPEPDDYGFYQSDSLPYEQITALPFLTDTSELTHNELTESGVSYNVSTQMTDKVDDGVYFGSLIGVTEDGSRALLRIGEPVSFDRDEMCTLEPGNPIGYYDLVVDRNLSQPDNGFYQIDLDSPSITDLTDSCLRACSSADEEMIYLGRNDGHWWLTDSIIVEVAVSDTVEVSDDYLEHIDNGLPEDRELTGNQLLDSSFWYYVNEEGRGSAHNNGWISTYATAVPVVISNGELSHIELVFDYGTETAK